MFLFYFTTIDYIIKTGSDLTTFGLFKEWAEDTIFVFRENNNDDGEIVLSVDVKINFEGSTHSLNWPGPFKECSDCKTSYEKSSFRNQLEQLKNSRGSKQYSKFVYECYYIFKIYTIKFMCEQITIYYCSPEIIFRKHFLF